VLAIFRKARKSWAAFAAAALVLSALAATASAAQAGTNPSTPPAMTLGTYQSSEDSSPDFIPIAGSGHPNVAPAYLSWGQGLPTTFMSSAYSQGATPYIEFEPWQQGPSWNATPSFSAIASNGDASDTNCSLDGSTYATSCATWLADVGKAIASYGHPVVLTFAHEFNVSGQYPWSQGDTGSCGSSPCTPAQWIAAWKEVQSIVDANAGGNAFWIWAPNADTGGTTTDPSPWWPGASSVDLVGVDGYPDTTYGSQFGTFSGEFGPVFSEIRNLGYTGGIFISETNLAPLDGSGYETIPQFVSDLCTAGGTGFLEWEDGGAPAMTSTQWGEANTALSSDCAGGSPPPTQGAPAVVTGSASGVTATTATLNGTVNPEGADASWQFDGGTDTTYGNVAPSPAGDAGSGASAVGESTTITGLTPSTTYHYRIEATNSAGTSYGKDVTFTTPSSCQYTAAPGTSPPNITSTVTGSRVVLGWGTVGGTTKYEALSHLPSGGVWYDSIGSATSATYDVAPTTGTYTYQVRAGNCYGWGPWSATKSFTVKQ
jgi:Glycosyl hydrolase family 26